MSKIVQENDTESNSSAAASGDQTTSTASATDLLESSEMVLGSPEKVSIAENPGLQSSSCSTNSEEEAKNNNQRTHTTRSRWYTNGVSESAHNE